MNARTLSVISALVAAIASPALAAAARFPAPLDDGSSVQVVSIVNDAGNAAQVARVKNLVLMADRSTRTSCPAQGAAGQAAYKGLIRSGDQVVVTNHYIAWFDYTD